MDDKAIKILASRDRIRNDMIEYAKKYLELEQIDFDKSSYLTYLINILSTLTSNLLYYNASVYREFFLTDAIQKESVLNLAAMIGYSPVYATPAQVELLLEMPVEFYGDEITLTIPKGFKYYAGNIVFRQDNKIEIYLKKSTNIAYVREYLETGGSRNINFNWDTENNKLYFLVNATQKDIIVLDYKIPELRPYEFYVLDVEFHGQISSIYVLTTTSEYAQIPEHDLEQYILQNKIGAIPGFQVWEKYDSLFLIPHQKYGFTFRQTSKGGQIFFGNNIVGVQPEAGSICKVIIETTEGSRGNVIAGSVNKASRLYYEEVINDKKVNRPVKINVINTNPATGGRDTETLDEIRHSAIANLRSAKRLVSKTDYDDITSIVKDLPIVHYTHILKRSDLKQNEITIFSDLIYNDTIVPTKNIIWEFTTTETSYKIYGNKSKVIIDEVEYYSMFDIDVDLLRKECIYQYLLDKTTRNLTVTRTGEYDKITSVLPKSAKFEVDVPDTGTAYLNVEYNYSQLISRNDLPPEDVLCKMILGWDGTIYDMTHVVDLQTGEFIDQFVAKVPLDEVPLGEQYFYFVQEKIVRDLQGNIVYEYDAFGNPIGPKKEILAESQVNLIIKQDLSQFMYSTVDVTPDPGTGEFHVKVYNVPVLKKSFRDKIDYDDFTRRVIEKVIDFDVISYRMLTDFINLKFADATGSFENMKYNKTTKPDVIAINPVSMPPQVDGHRYIVTEPNNPWGREPPFIVEWSSESSKWLFDRLEVNDIVYVSALGKKALFNGNRMVVPVATIPLQIRIIVWRDPSYATSDQALIYQIKENLINNLHKKFGFDSSLYISEIVDIVQEVPGVSHCQVIEPVHDIFVNYDIYTDLTTEQLLEYTPQLLYFDTNSISVEIKTNSL